MCNRTLARFSSVVFLVILLFASVRCSDDALFTKIFIDEVVQVPDLTLKRIDTMMEEVEAMPISDFCNRMAYMYFQRCYSLDPSSAAPLYCKCDRDLETNFDFAPFLKKMTPNQLIYFAKLPPGRLRREMFQRLCEYDHFEPDFFEAFNQFICHVLPFETVLINDLIPWFNDNMEKIGSVGHREQITSTASWNIVQLTMPENFHRIRLVNWIWNWTNEGAFLRPFPGMEKHFTLSKLIQYLPNLTGYELSESFQHSLIERLPLILIDGKEEMRREWALPFLKGLQQLRVGCKGLVVDFKAPELHKYTDKALSFIESEDEREFFRYLLYMQTDVESSYTEIGSLESPVFIEELSSDPCAHICQFASVPNDLKRSQQSSQFSSGPANPANFMNILTGHDSFEFFRQFDKYGKYLTEAQKKAVMYLATVAFGEDLFSRLALLLERTRLLRPPFRVACPNATQEFFLHSLYFKIGAFEGLKSSIQTSFESMAYLFFPQQCSKLMAARKRLGVRPNIENLFMHHFVNKFWVLEMYCRKDINVQNPQSILRLTNDAVTKTEICNLAQRILINLQKFRTVRGELSTLTRIISLAQFVATGNNGDEILKRVLADFEHYTPRLHSCMTMKGDNLKLFAESYLHNLSVYHPLKLPLFVFVWQLRSGEQPELNLSKTVSFRSVEKFITRIVKKEYGKDELPMMKKKLYCLLRMLAEYTDVRLDIFLDGMMNLIPLDMVALLPDELYQIGSEHEAKYEGLTIEMIQGFGNNSGIGRKGDLLAFRLNPTFENAKLCILELIDGGMSPQIAYQRIKDFFEHDSPVAEGYYQELDQFISNLPAWFGKKLVVDERTKNLTRIISIEGILHLVHENITGCELYMFAAERYGNNHKMEITVADTEIVIQPNDEVVPLGCEFSVVLPD